MESSEILFTGKKSFTLLEVIISVTIFMIVLLFLYKTLDQTKHSNKLFENKQKIVKSINHLNTLILEDIAEKTNKLKITYTDEKNTNIVFKSNNTFHNPYYVNIAYLVSSNDKLVRVESLNEFKFENTNYDFYDTAYVDILLEDIELFEVQNNVFIIKQKDKKKIVIKAFNLKDIK